MMSTLRPSKKMSTLFHNLLVIEKKTIDSTQDEALRLLQKQLDNISLPYVVIAEEQTSGRGRAGRKWIAPAKKNIYFSLAIEVPKHWYGNMHLLSGSVSLSIQHQLQKLGISNAQVKWPNDIVINNKKLCGIIVELTSTPLAIHAIIGVGMNLNMAQDECDKLLDRPITSLLAETEKVWNVEKTASLLLEKILDDIMSQENPPSLIFDKWIEQCSWMLGQLVKTHHLNGDVVEGKVLQFSKNGSMLIYNNATQKEEEIDIRRKFDLLRDV